MMTSKFVISLSACFLLAPFSLAVAQEETRDAYFDPQNLPADIAWGNIDWLDADGQPTAAPDENTNVYLSGQRAAYYRHVVVPAGSDITVNSLTLANSGWGSNASKTLEISGTADNLVKFSVKNAITFEGTAGQFNSIYADYTNFSAGSIAISYFGLVDFKNSTVDIGKITTANVSTMAFSGTSGTVAGISTGHSGNLNIQNSSDITVTEDFYSNANWNFNFSDSKATFAKTLSTATQANFTVTNSTVDINTGLRSGGGALVLNLENSSIVVRGVYGSSKNGIHAAGNGSFSLVNSTISTGANDITINSDASTISISMMDASQTLIECGNLNFTGILTVDFTGMDLARDTDFTLISAANAGTVFQALLDGGKVEVLGLKAGESYSWNISDTSVVLSFAAIPEPAAYAALFGALALAFAAYRRRV